MCLCVCVCESHTCIQQQLVFVELLSVYHQGDFTSSMEDTTSQDWEKSLILSFMNASIQMECPYGWSNDDFNF